MEDDFAENQWIWESALTWGEEFHDYPVTKILMTKQYTDVQARQYKFNESPPKPTSTYHPEPDSSHYQRPVFWTEQPAV